jgi:hypothetical protein
MLSGKSARITAGELGINEQNLHKWKQPFKALQAENRRLQKELHRVAQQRDILKNPGPNLRTRRQRFERIKAMHDEYSIAELCGTLAVTRSGYHA